MAELIQRGVFVGDNVRGFHLTEFGEEVATECCLRWDSEVEASAVLLFVLIFARTHAGAGSSQTPRP